MQHFQRNFIADDSSDVLTNVIMELKNNEHIEPSVSVKGASYLRFLSVVGIY